jgi:hypothetical protein
MGHHARSARYLDEPFRPLLGLSVAQAVALGVILVLAYGSWQALGSVLGQATITSPAGQLRLTLVGVPAAALYGVVHMLTGGRTERPVQQLWRYCWRRHRHAPRLPQGSARAGTGQAPGREQQP